jgi:hypothetical protein
LHRFFQSVFWQHTPVNTRAHHENVRFAGQEHVQVRKGQMMAVFSPPPVRNPAVGKYLDIGCVGISLNGYFPKLDVIDHFDSFLRNKPCVHIGCDPFTAAPVN